MGGRDREQGLAIEGVDADVAQVGCRFASLVGDHGTAEIHRIAVQITDDFDHVRVGDPLGFFERRRERAGRHTLVAHAATSAERSAGATSGQSPWMSTNQRIESGIECAASAQRSEPVRGFGEVRTTSAPAALAAASTSSESVATTTCSKQSASTARSQVCRKSARPVSFRTAFRGRRWLSIRTGMIAAADPATLTVSSRGPASARCAFSSTRLRPTPVR